MRRLVRHIAGAAVAATLCLNPVRAQEPPAILRVETNAPAADLYVDGSLLGKAGTRYFAIDPAARTVEVVLARRYSWSVPSRHAAIGGFSSGDTVTVDLRFPYYYRLESTPSRATVRLINGPTVLLGHTPVTVERPEPLDGALEFSKDGFRTVTASPGRAVWNLHEIDLEAVGALNRNDFALSTPETRRKWIDYAAVGTALVAGALAVHFKFKADDRFDRYQETGDPDLRPGIKRYDIYSGVALGVMQAGMGLFAIRLVMR